MKIKRIVVKNLFGIFYHEIPLNLDDQITIIHGPNGFGKTIILTALSKFFNKNFSSLIKIPFDELSIDFDNNDRLSITRNTKYKEVESQKELEETSKLTVELWKDETLIETYPIKENDGISLTLIEKILPNFRRVGDKSWLDRSTGMLVPLNRILDVYGDELRSVFNIETEKPQWLEDILNSLDVHLIETQRLLNFQNSSPKYRHTREINTPIPVVQEYSMDLASAIEKNLAEYGSLSQSLDRTFPKRLVERETTTILSIEELKSQLTSLEQKRSLLEKTGLLDKEKDEINWKDLFEKIDESNRHIMSAYIQDTITKLNTFDELYSKISMLAKIINNRFLYKKISINRTKGFFFETSKGEIISPQFLSSGEQHELVLFYELLFNVSSNSLILIDEPELSLHVFWQEQFLNDLIEITKIRGFDVLMATHSPDIINNKWELTVELKGPEYEKI